MSSIESILEMGSGYRKPLHHYGDTFQTSTSRQPLPTFATTPPMSHPGSQSAVTCFGTGIGPMTDEPVNGFNQSLPGSMRSIQKWSSISPPCLAGAVSSQ